MGLDGEVVKKDSRDAENWGGAGWGRWGPSWE